MKSKYVNRICLIVMLLISGLGVIPRDADADVMYDAAVKDSFQHSVPVQPPYQPVGYVGREIFVDDPKNPGEKIPSLMKNPNDVFIDGKDYIYIADTGNNRIIKFDPDGGLNRIITLTESPFNQPQGVFVSDHTGDIYVADTGNKRVVRLNQQGKLLQTIEKPESPFIPKDYKYDPIKLVVDKRGFLYIATLGGYQGLLQLDPEGQFISFFGSNTIQMTLVEKVFDNIKKMIYNDEMLANELSQLPGSVDNVAIDERGFIYTVTKGQNIKSQQIKILNIKGTNLIAKSDNLVFNKKLKILGSAQAVRKFGEVTKRQTQGRSVEESLPQLIDVAIDTYGNMTAIDSNFKNVSFYDSDGNPLFFWINPSSTSLTQLGLQRSPVSVAYNSKNELFILDNQDNLLGKFVLNHFGKMVLDANALTLEGRYEESTALWKEVLQFNSEYPPAFIGLARSEYQQGNYKEAYRLFKLGQNQLEFSNAFWQIRLEWLHRHFASVASILIFGGLALWICLKIIARSKWGERWRNRKRSQIPLVIHLKHAFYVLRHPVDGFSAIRYESKGGYISALILLALSIITTLFTNFYTSFSFNKIDTETIQLLPILLQFIVVWLGWVVCNYFIGSIMRGEARFKDVFIGSAYALMPLILCGIPLAILSNGMSFSEQTIYYFMSSGIVIWTGLMFIWNVQALQNYFVGEALINILVTLFAMVMVAVMIFLIYSLSDQFIQFILSIYREVIMR